MSDKNMRYSNRIYKVGHCCSRVPRGDWERDEIGSYDTWMKG